MKTIILSGIMAILLALSPKVYSQQKAGPEFKAEFLSYVNRTRQTGCKCGTSYMRPVAPLVWNDVLEKAALAHARDMGEHNYFSHESRNGLTSSDRIMAAGYNYTGFKSFSTGENIAFGQTSIPEVMAGWFKSEGHCKNLMSADFKEIGIAQYNTYWVQDFGGRIPFSDEQKRLLKSGRIRLVPVQPQTR